MAWVYVGVLNTGLQMLACMLMGWACAKFQLVNAADLSQQLNEFAVKVAIPAFILHLLGIKSDLRNLDAWRALGIYLLWALSLQVLCVLWMKLRRDPETGWQRLGINVLLLTANNTGLVGTPVVTAALGPDVAPLGLLIGMLVTLEMLPIAVTCFEWQRWKDQPPQRLMSMSRSASRRASQCSAANSTPGAPGQAAAAAASLSAAPSYMVHADLPLAVLWTAPSAPLSVTPAASTQVDAWLPPGLGAAVPRALPAARAASSPVPALYAADDGADQSAAPGTLRCRSQQYVQKQAATIQLSPATIQVGSVAAPTVAAPQAVAAGGTDPDSEEPAGSDSVPDGSDVAAEDRVALSTGSTDALPGPAVSAPTETTGCFRRQSSNGGAAGTNTTSKPPLGSPGPHNSSSNLTSRGDRHLFRSSSSNCSAPGSRRSTASSGGVSVGARAAATLSISSLTEWVASSPFAFQPSRQRLVCDSAASCSEAPGARQRHGQVARQQAPAASKQEQEFESSNDSYKQADDLSSGKGALVTVQVTVPRSKQQAASPGCSGQDKAGYTSFKGYLQPPQGNSNSSARRSYDKGGAGYNMGDTSASGLQRAPTAEVCQLTSGTSAGGCFFTFLVRHPQLRQLLALQAKNHLLWCNLLAVAMSLSGLRRWLDPASPQAISALAWIEGTLRWGSSTCVPVMLFANGVWMYGKPIISRKTSVQVLVYVLLRMLLLPVSMALVCVMFGIRDVRGMALVILACTPVAQLTFVLSQQYDAGAEVVTGVIILGIAVMLPHTLGCLQLAKATGLFTFALQGSTRTG